MLGYESQFNRSMNGVKTVTDGQAVITNGNVTATNITGTNIYGTIITPAQTNITSVGTLTGLNVNGTSNLGNTSITGTLGVSGTSTLSTVNCGALTTSANSAITQSGTGYIDQLYSTGLNYLSTIFFNVNANFNQSGTGAINQSGGSTNYLKATRITGLLTQIGNINQTAGSNTLLDTTIGNITQSGSNVISQLGTGTNILKGTQISDLTVTTSLTIPSDITMPSATFNGDTSYIGTAKIVQSGSTGINSFNGSSFNGDVVVTGNFNMTGGAATSSLKTPTITGLTTCEGITQNSGTCALRGITCNQIDINSNYDLIFAGTGKIGQTTSTGTNLMSAITLNSNKDLTFGGTGRINQNTSTGANTFAASLFKDNVTLDAGKILTFTNNQPSRKIILYDNDPTTIFNQSSFSTESGILRYNTGTVSTAHVFSHATTNSGATSYTEMCRINNNGLGLGTNTPAYKLHVFGTTKLDGANIFTTSLNGVTPATFAFLDATSSIQQQLDNTSSTGTTNTGNITTLLTKTTNQSYSAGTTSFTGTLSAPILNASGLITGSNGLTINSGNTSLLTVDATTATISAGLNINSSSASSTLQGQVTLWGDGTFPTAATSSQGMSVYMTGGTGRTRILNRAQGGVGGFEFHSVNSVHTPNLLAAIDDVGSMTLQQHLNAVNGVFSGSLSSAGHTSTSLNTGVVTCTGITCNGSTTINNTGLTALTVLGSSFFNNIKSKGTSAISNGSLEFINYLGVNQALMYPSYASDIFKFDSNMTNGVSFAHGGANTFTVDNSGNGEFIGGLTSSSLNSGNGDFTGGLTSSSLNTGVVTCTDITSSAFKSSNGSATITMTNNSHATTVLLATITTTPYYNKTITFESPISVSLTCNVPLTFDHNITGWTCVLKKNGVFHSTLSPTYSRGLNIYFLFDTNGQYNSSANYFLMMTNLTVTIPSDSVSNVFTIEYTFTKASGNTTSNVFNINTTTNSTTLVNCFKSNGTAYGSGFKYKSYVENLYTGLNSGFVEMNDVQVNGNFRSINTCGAIMYPENYTGYRQMEIYTSIDSYVNIYPSSGDAPTVGSFLTAQTYNDADDSYLVFPGFQLIVYDATNYTGNITLNYINHTSKPQLIAPTTGDVGSSCKLYFNSVLL